MSKWVKVIISPNGRTEFPVKARKNASGLVIDSEPREEIRQHILENGYTGNFYKEIEK